jgi:hypothetical protein
MIVFALLILYPSSLLIDITNPTTLIFAARVGGAGWADARRGDEIKTTPN